MFRILFVFLSCALFLFTITMANPCPCEVIANQQLSNEPSTAMLEPTLDEILDKKFLESYFERLPAGSSMETSSESFPSHHQEKHFDLSAQRNKRPSWAAVGKRTISYINKRPSWAQVG